MTEGELLELAWGIIANSSGGDWTKEKPEWQGAAARWRDNYHTWLHDGYTAMGLSVEATDQMSRIASEVAV